MTFGVNDYPGTDPYGFAPDQCASFANWRCVNDLKIGPQQNPNGTINGGQFAAFLGTKGYAVDGNPRVHDIVSLPPGVDGAGPYGHVAIVLQAPGNGTVFVEDYNWADTGQYAQHWISAAGCQFAHVEDDEVRTVLVNRNPSTGAIEVWSESTGFRHVDTAEENFLINEDHLGHLKLQWMNNGENAGYDTGALGDTPGAA